MKNITKILVSLLVLFGTSFSAYAGTLTVSGTAKATYGTISGYNTGDNGIGVENAITLGASGELDNGFTWAYATALDPANTAEGGAALNDDTKLTIGTPYGTVAVCISDCGLSAALDFSTNVYGLMSDTGYAEGKLEPTNISSYNSMQYHSPAGLLPFGTVLKVAYSNSGSQLINATNVSSVDKSSTVGNTTMYRIETKPVDGLSVAASYAEQDGGDVAGRTDEQKNESGAIAAKYNIGQIALGVGKTWSAPTIADDVQSTSTTVETITNNNYSIGFAVNDQMSVSYSHEKSKPVYSAKTTAYDMTVKSIQAAYTMGGMTIALARTDYDNASYTNNKDVTETILGLTLAF